MFKTIEWFDGKVRIIDQSKLPFEEVYLVFENYQDLAEAIKTMKIRGAPAIGVAAAFGVALGAKASHATQTSSLLDEINHIFEVLAHTRPTAINLFWALKRMKEVASTHAYLKVDDLKRVLEEEALKIAREDAEINRKIGEIGKDLINDGDSILTHCNAGALATVEYGTALGVIRAAFEEGKHIQVYATETRPLLQGARLTMWELTKEGVPSTLIVDSLAGFLMRKGKINKVMVGADRIAANGDSANKVGTYSLAVLAKENNLPFYIVAPTSTIDLSISLGEKIPIEERGAKEVTQISDVKIAADGTNVLNLAFDVTDAKYISAIITEKGILYPPYLKSLAKLKKYL